MSHHLNDIVKVNASSWQTFWKCSLRNPLKAPTGKQEALAFVLNIILIGIPYFFTKAWDIKNERGKYHLVNPREIGRLKAWGPTQSALKADAIFLLKMIYEENPGAFLEKLDGLYNELKDYHQWSQLTDDQLQKLAQLRRLYAVAKQQVGSDDSSKNENWEKTDSGSWVGRFSQASSYVKTLSDRLQDIEEEISPLWDRFLSSNPLLEHDAEGKRNKDLLQKHMGQLGRGDALQQIIAQQRRGLERTQ